MPPAARSASTPYHAGRERERLGRTPTLKRRANCFDDLIEIREVAGLALGKDAFPINADFEHAATRGDEFDRSQPLFEFEKFDRQTDGFRFVISGRAIFDREFRFHRGKNVVRARKSVQRFKTAAP